MKVIESGRMFYGIPGFFLKATLVLKGHARKTHRHDPHLEIDFLSVNKITFLKRKEKRSLIFIVTDDLKCLNSDIKHLAH